MPWTRTRTTLVTCAQSNAKEALSPGTLVDSVNGRSRNSRIQEEGGSECSRKGRLVVSGAAF